MIHLARRIGNELYWPITELDLLYGWNSFGRNNERQSSRFVCTESTTIFDNLVNQTFTVINSLQLSQYKDNANQQEAIKSADIDDASFNLYACIVDADVRHNYATLGVYFKEGPNSKLSIDLSKRLKARSIINKKLHKRHEPELQLEKQTTRLYQNSFDFYRDSSLECK